MRSVIALAILATCISTPSIAGGALPMTQPGAMTRPTTIPHTGPGSSSFNSYLQSHSGLRQFNPAPTPVPNTGPGSASFNSYLQSHSGLSQFNPTTR